MMQEDALPPNSTLIVAPASAARTAAVRVDAGQRHIARPSSERPGGIAGDRREQGMSTQLPEPRLTQLYRLEATVDAPLDLGDTGRGRHRSDNGIDA